MGTGFLTVPDWFPRQVSGAGIALSDLKGDGTVDMLLLTVDEGANPNTAAYRVGIGVDTKGQITGRWTDWIDVPDWFMFRNQGADLTAADITGSGQPDLLVLAVDAPEGVNRGMYRLGRDIEPDGQVSGGWTPWIDIPNWFSFENQDAAVAVADLNGTGRPDLVVFTIDNPPGVNRAIYQIGRDLDTDGVATGGWTGWIDVPDWFSWDNQGAGAALVPNPAGVDLIVFAVDNPEGPNQAFYRVLPGLRADGSGGGGWGTYMGVPNWFPSANQAAGIAFTTATGEPQLALVMVDAPPGTTTGYYRFLDLIEKPERHGRWDVTAAHSGVLAIHAAVLRTGKVIFFAGTGNNQVRAADGNFGDLAKGLYTSAVWDPIGGSVTHPDTIHGDDGKPFDFFCGGDTFLPDGRLLSAGGNQAYVAKGRRDVVAFDPRTEQWEHCAPMRDGRWYPTLLPLADGGVLAVSGIDQTGTQHNKLFEIYTPATDIWKQRPTPDQDLFFGLPLYPHVFLLQDGRVLFDGGRMDDALPQGPVLIDLTTDPLRITGVPGLEDPQTRNQAASVMLPPVQDQKVMIIGGGPEDATNGTGSTAVVDLSRPNPAFQPATSMSLPRMHLNAVLLPDRTVFVSGGALAREDRIGARLQSEIYHPTTGTWTSAATAQITRMYHSVALLLPDGRVVSAGGNPPPYGQQVAWEPPDPNEEMRLEIYSPPYLFGGPRPAITQAPTECGYGQQFVIGTPNGRDVQSASLIRPGVTTHAFDNSQRLVDLPINQRGPTELTLTSPRTTALAPPGWYMLFILDRAGIPSIASWIQLKP